MSAFGEALARLMGTRGVGVHELARMSNYTAGHISNLRTGAKRASLQCAATLDDLLGAGGELIAAAGHRELTAEPDPGDLGHPVVPLPALDSDDVHPVEHLDRFRGLISESDNLFGPRNLISLVRRHVALIARMRHGRSGSDSRELLRMQARYAESLAWLYQDCTQFRDAQYWLDRSLEWAHMADDRQWAAFTLARKSQLAGDMHDSASAVDLADAAARMAEDSTRLAAAGAAYQAHGHALSGDAAASLRALDRAHDIAERPEDDPGAPWAAWLTTGYVGVQRARCLTALGDHQNAAGLFARAIDGIPPELRRDKGVYLARLAVAQARSGDLDQAASAGLRAATIYQATASGRILTELRLLDAATARAPAQATAVLRDALAGILRHSPRGRKPRP
ncbi:MAG TPA: helix-turn-helix domain-containing protein [Streptosporangiaceae bacterium]|jgi:tetratricopeptide (TPR) repeat protein